MGWHNMLMFCMVGYALYCVTVCFGTGMKGAGELGVLQYFYSSWNWLEKKVFLK
jgi:hypothetical protein